MAPLRTYKYISRPPPSYFRAKNLNVGVFRINDIKCVDSLKNKSLNLSQRTLLCTSVQIKFWISMCFNKTWKNIVYIYFPECSCGALTIVVGSLAACSVASIEDRSAPATLRLCHSTMYQYIDCDRETCSLVYGLNIRQGGTSHL